MRNLNFTKKDFRLEWYSGSGAGGQHRNKHQNCCRITHLETGIVARGTEGRDRVSNQKKAFTTLIKRIQQYYAALDAAPPNISNEVIRTYHAERNEVRDKASDLRLEYTYVVQGRNLTEMIEARASAMNYKDILCGGLPCSVL